MAGNPLLGTFLQLRRFSSGLNLGLPLQPLKQRKTTPIRNPRRPHLPDPLDTDPTAQRFKLADHPQVLLVVREPSGIPNVADELLKPPPVNTKSSTEPPLPAGADEQQSEDIDDRFSHPLLSRTTPSSPPSAAPVYQLPPRLRQPKVYPTSLTPAQAKEVQKLRTSLSVSQISRRFGISRLLVSILGPPSKDQRKEIQLKNQMRQLRRETRWSVAKAVRRQEKMIRRSMW